MKANRKWCIAFISIVLIVLIGIGCVTVIVDPYFHYHAPLDGLEYPLSSERQRYINDGILKNFNYDSIIIGSSMTENFKTSQWDEMFGTNSVKVCYSGTTFYEVRNNLQTAFEKHPDIQTVVMSADIIRLCDDKDMMRYDLTDYPMYLYDDNYFNDVSYLFNKDVLFDDLGKVLKHTLSGQKTTTFDEYSNNSDKYVYSKETVDAGYDRLEKTMPDKTAMEDQHANVKQNVTQNIVELAKQNPNVQFYVFFPPYSIYYWDDMNQRGLVEWQYSNIVSATQLMVECDNIHLFAFFDKEEIICNLNNYKDFVHYSEDINEYILNAMHEGSGRLTSENYEQYFDNVIHSYVNYDYDALFE